MIYYNKDFPQLLTTKYILDPNTKQRMIDTVLSQRNSANYYGGYTFKVTDQYGDFKKIFNFFLDSVTTVFGRLTLSPRHKSWCWANVYNKDDFKTNIHDHQHSCSINSVFYLKMPAGISATEGGLAIANGEELFSIFQPAEGDLIIMPSTVAHEPQSHSSTDTRIAINMEITTEDHYSSYYTLENIYANARAQ